MTRTLEDGVVEHRTGDIGAGGGVKDGDILVFFDHSGEVRERHIGSAAGVVEPPVRVALDRDRFVDARHLDRSQSFPRTVSIALFAAQATVLSTGSWGVPARPPAPRDGNRLRVR